MNERTARSRLGIRRLASVYAAVILGLAGITVAGPEDYYVVYGNLLINQNGNVWIIEQTGQYAILQAGSFDVSQFETVQFLQSPTAKLLNYIVGDSPTQIDGNVFAQGIVYFVNPAGVIFGNGSVINAGHIYAAAANLGNPMMNPADLDAALTNVLDINESGTVSFTNVTGPVTLDPGSSIAATGVHLVGTMVANHGQITIAPGGVLTMSAGEEVVLVGEIGNPVSVVINAGAAPSGPGVYNGPTGQINAGGAQVVLGAGDIYSLAVQQSGQLTAGALQVNGASQIDTDITADSAVFNGAVAVGNDAAGNGVVEISAVTGAVFNGTVDSVAGETNGLVVNGPSTFMQAIGGSAALSTLTVNGSANINGGSVTTTGGQIWNGAVVLGADTTLTGTTMMFTTAVNGLSDGAQSLLINGNVVLGGTVGATARLASLQVNGTTNLNGGIVITMGNQVYNGDVLLGANTMLTAGTIQFLSSVDAAVAGAQFLDLIGNVEFGGDVGGTNALAWLDVHGTTVLGADVTTVGTQTYRSATTLASDVTLHGPLVLFFGSIDGVSPGGQSLAIDGAVIFGDGVGNDAVGGQVALASLDVTGASVINGGLVMTTGLQHYQGSVHLGADTTLGASSVHFGSTVNGLAAGGEDLVIDGDAVFDGAVGDGVLLGSLTVSGSSAVNGGLMQTVGDQSYGGDVTLGANTVFNGGSLLFESRVDSDGTPRNLVANSSGNGVTRFGGSVGATSPLGALFTNADGVTEINDDITVTAGADFQDAVQLTGNSKITDTGMAGITFRQTIDGGFELTVETLGDALFEGNIGAVSPLARFETIVHGTMIIDCSLIQATGDIVFNEGVGLVEIPVVATIGASGSLVIRSTAGDFRMGHLQKLSVLGDLTIEALSATISDLSTLGNMIIDAGAIFILTREPGLVLLANGELVMDDGVDFVAGGQFFFTVAPVAVGAGVVRFGSPTGEGDALGTLSAFTMQATGPISVENLFQPGSRSGLGGRLLPGTWLDARTQGPTTTDVGQTIAAAFPRDDEKEAVETTVMPGPATRQRLLRDLAIRSRSLDRLEVIELLGGLGIFDDTPRTTVDVLRQQPQVVVNRLPIEHVDDVLASFDELLAVADAGDIQAGLERAWRSYGQATGADATPAGLAGWLASSGDEATLMHLGLLDSLVRNIIVTGLAPAELVGPLENVARAYFPRDLGAGGMLEMVNGMEAATLPVATPRPGGTVDAAAEPAAE